MIEILATASAALLPVATDGIRAVINRVTGGAGANPANVAERIELQNADTERLRALAALDQTGDTFKWVNAVKALQRPIAVGVILATYAGSKAAGVEIGPDLSQFTQAVVFYLFGERTNMYARRYMGARAQS